MATFKEDLEDLISRHGRENDSNTPDFLLAVFLENCLLAYNAAVQHRDRFNFDLAAAGQEGATADTPDKVAYQPTIAVDLDGVIHAYSRGWEEGVLYDEANEGTEKALARLNEHGYRVVVLTARTDHDAVREWVVKQGLEMYVDEVTNVKPGAMAYIDDRAVRFDEYGWPGVMRRLERRGLIDEN